MSEAESGSASTESENESGKPITLERLKFCLNLKRVPVELPDAGMVEIFPYLSAGAMGAASSTKVDKQVLGAIYAKSVEDQKNVPSENFTEADWDRLAKHFLTVDSDADSNNSKAIASYENAIDAGTDARSAFAPALKMTTGWKESVRSMQRQMDAESRMLRQHEQTSAALLRRYQMPQLGTQFAAMSIVDRYAIKMPELHLGLQSSINRALSDVKLLAAIQTPNLKIKVPKFDFGRIELQLAGFQSFHGRQLTAFKQLDAALKASVTPDFVKLTGLTSLNKAIASSIKQVVDANRLFAARDYMSPPRIRAEVIMPNESTEWVDELEEAEEAIVLETITNRELIASIVKEEMHEIRDELKREAHPQLNDFVESLTNPEEFADVLRLFTKRVAREDSRLFWSDYGKKFLPSPEAIGKSLLGVFLEGYCCGKAFIAHELRTGEGYVDVVVFYQGKTFILELKVVGAGWSFGKAKSGLDQLDYYEDMYADAEMFLVIFDGRKTERGERLPDEHKLDCGKTARVLSVPIFTIAPTRKQ